MQLNRNGLEINGLCGFELYADFPIAAPNDAYRMLDSVRFDPQFKRVRNVHAIVDFEPCAERRQVPDNTVKHRQFVNNDLAAFERSAPEIRSTFAHTV